MSDRGRQYLRGDAASRFLRGQLAAVGIFLDEPDRPRAPVDRDEARGILAAAGAPLGEIERLVEQCPSLEWARAYRPPTTEDTDE